MELEQVRDFRQNSLEIFRTVSSGTRSIHFSKESLVVVWIILLLKWRVLPILCRRHSIGIDRSSVWSLQLIFALSLFLTMLLLMPRQWSTTKNLLALSGPRSSSALDPVGSNYTNVRIRGRKKRLRF